MPQWFCWYSRSGRSGCRRTQCGSWPNSGSGSGKNVATAARVERLPVVAAVGALEHAAAPTGRCRGARRRAGRRSPSAASSRRACSRTGHSAHVSHSLWSFQPLTGSHVSPPSSVRNRPCGDPPAYQTPGSLLCPGVSQNTAFRLRCKRVARSRTRAAASPRSTIGRGRSSGTPSGRDGRCASRAAASCDRADRAPCAARCDRGTSARDTVHDERAVVGRRASTHPCGSRRAASARHRPGSSVSTYAVVMVRTYLRAETTNRVTSQTVGCVEIHRSLQPRRLD